MMNCRLIPVAAPNGVTLFAIVDPEYFEVLNSYNWRLSDSGYARRTVTFNNVTYTRYMHRVVLDMPDTLELQGDHINGNRLDNRRANLRVVIRDENARNRFVQSGKRGGVIYKGVYANTNCATFTAKIRVNGKLLNLGSFRNQEDAARAYDEAALIHFGEHAKLNFELAPHVRPKLEASGIDASGPDIYP